MAINYAEKYSAKIDERFKQSALSTAAVNNEYDFVGVKTVKVYSIETVEMGDYTRAGANRYGTPAELQDTVQELTMTQDRAFTFTIDKGNNEDQMGVKNAGKALQRQIDERVVPEIDKYRFSVMAAKAKNSATAALTKENAYEAFLNGNAALDDELAPATNRVAYVTPEMYKLLKLDSAFIHASDIAQNMLIKGQVGEVDGVRIVKVPTSYLPANVAFIITNQIATVAPVKLAEYKVHDNPPGINGYLVEGRVYYDAFVLNNKAGAIYKHLTA
ncbi:MAG: N4-gp56 family major capsid protein [Phascolarctobacterium sp.]|nr:N4-gp56 family major capsid protein [Phascolarctobacterium sp.]